MSLKHNINHIRFLINQGADLLLLRLQILGIPGRSGPGRR